MQKIPFDIIINHIIPYTYNIQSKSLLEDIKNYNEIKTKLMNDKYDTDIIKHEILANCYINRRIYNNVLQRHYQTNLKKFDNTCQYKYSQNTRFNFLFGLLTPEERHIASEYIFNELSRWIEKTS